MFPERSEGGKKDPNGLENEILNWNSRSSSNNIRGKLSRRRLKNAKRGQKCGKETLHCAVRMAVCMHAPLRIYELGKVLDGHPSSIIKGNKKVF